MAAKTLVIASHKGGTGKTTTAVTIGHRLAQLGGRVLLVDLDAQGNLSEFLGVEPGPGVFQLLVERRPLDQVVVSSGRERLDVVSGDHTSARAARLLVGEPGLDYRLKRALQGVAYDWTIFDTAPSLGLLQSLAFAASDLLLIPSELNYASGLGVSQVLRTVATLKRDINLSIELAGILPTKWDRRITDADRQLKALSQRFPKKVWLPVPTDQKAAEAPAYASTLWEYAPHCAALKGRQLGGRWIGGYRQTVERLLREAKP